MTTFNLSSIKARYRAFVCLCHLLHNKGSLSSLLTHEDNSFTKELSFGVCRYLVILERILSHYIKKMPKDIEVKVCLFMGCYQLFVMKQPDYAIVKETVGLLDKTRFTHAKGFVNGVLRQMSRDKEAGKDIFKLEVLNGGTPPWLVKKLQTDWPKDWQEIVKANLSHAPMTLRVNIQKGSRDAYFNLLKEFQIKAIPHLYIESAVTLEKPVSVNLLPGFSEGKVSVQDASAQVAAFLLDLKPNLNVLDACAAPGGKTGHILELAPHLGRCVAVDIDTQRIARIHENLQRLGLTAEVIRADMGQVQDWGGTLMFDRILFDAPCSALGVIRRHPDIQVLRNQKEVDAICEVQSKLLRNIWSYLKDGGRLVYATCSVLKQENDCQIANFVKEYPNAKIVEFNLPWGRKTRYGWQLLPDEATGDGFFYAILEKGLSISPR